MTFQECAEKIANSLHNKLFGEDDYKSKSQNQIAKELGISKSYLSDILNGKKGCNTDLKEKLLQYYPNLKFIVYNPRWKIMRGE